MKKYKFKKGDKVRVIKEGFNFRHIEATVNSVRKFTMPFRFFVDIPGFVSQHFTEDELEYFQPNPQNK